MAEEKLIPLDTSGNDVEVTLKEEVNESEVTADESNIREIPPETKEEETKKEEVKETTENKDEL